MVLDCVYGMGCYLLNRLEWKVASYISVQEISEIEFLLNVQLKLVWNGIFYDIKFGMQTNFQWVLQL